MSTEKAVFSVHAHVFQIDPETKKKWLPSSTASIRVAYYHDPTRKTYRIIAIEAGKPLVNSTVTANMSFTKTSPKFGQWSDHRANTIYGLGFSTEKDLGLFSDKFMEAKTAAKALLEERKKQKHDTSGQDSSKVTSPSRTDEDSLEPNGQLQPSPLPSPSVSPAPSSTTSQTTTTPTTATVTTPSTTPTPVSTATVNGSDKPSSDEATSRPGNSSSKQGSLDQQVESLKFENSKLKVALASSAQNVKKWESEMQTLRNSNAMLKTALEESAQHVAEWKKQLQKYKDECDQLKKKIVKQDESSQGMENIQKENEELKEVLSAVQTDLESKREEAIRLQESLTGAEDKLNAVNTEKQTLQTQLSEARHQLEETKSSHQSQLSSVQDKHTRLGVQLQQLLSLHQEMATHLH